ncbi:retrovirus-related Pol polyprotein from transposon opus [Trichonephila clavipes]|nr:retrovirus-related Pol polyprotein from transposon opus [Trichonephila clavipes]
MFDPSSFANPTPLAHADTSRDVLPRGGISQWRPTRFNLYDPVMRNERGFNVWPEQRQNQEPTDFVYDLLKLNKKLELGMSEKALVDHIFVRLEPQVQYYEKVRNPQTAIQLLEVLAKFEERYSCKATLGSRNSNNVDGRGWNERRISNVGNNRGKWRNSEVVRRPNNGRNDYRGNYQNNHQGNQWFESRNRFQNDDRRFNDRGLQFRNRGQNDDFSRGDQRNRSSSENFSQDSRKQMGRLSVLKVSDIKVDQMQSINQSPIKLSAICMSPVELPYVPILLDETFTKALWDTGAEKSFISEETYQKYFFYKQVKKSSTQVITAQGAKCRNMGVVELNIRIRDFEKPWLFHVLANLEYPCILGIDFIGGSKIILDFDRKSLAIPDSQINKVVKTVEIEKVEIDLSKTTLEEIQKRELQDFFNSFQELFSDKPGLIYVLYDEIDTGDNPPVVSRPYRYDRLKQEILDYHVDKMLKDGTIIPIQSPYAAPVVLCRKNNGLPPDNPEAYRFAVDYRKPNAITKYPRYPLPLIDDLIMNIPHRGIMSALDLRSGYFQMAVNPSDIVKTAFVTKNGTYAFCRMPFVLSGAAPNFQKASDIILKPVIGKFVSVYMDDVIISSPSFTQHVKHLKEVFRLLHEAVLTLNKYKCKFGCEELKYLGLITNKEGIKTDEAKVQAIVEMKPPRHSKEVSKFLGMSQWKCDETEIGTGSSDNGSLRDESSGFDRVQRRSNESRDGKKKGSEVKRELEEKGLSFRNNQGYKRSNESRSGVPERKVQNGSEHRVNKRNLSSNDSNSMLPRLRKRKRREETVTPTTSGYNLRPRKGKREQSRLTIGRKTQQGGPVRSRKGRERNDSPHIEERTRSSNKNARRGGNQQRQDQERRGTCTKKSLSLEVLVGNANYTSHKNQVVSFLFIFFRTSGRKNFCNKAKSRSDN